MATVNIDEEEFRGEKDNNSEFKGIMSGKGGEIEFGDIKV